jgi:hypothetical protein
MWNRNFLANTFRGHDGFSAGWANDSGQGSTGRPDRQHVRPVGTGETPPSRGEPSFGRPLNLLRGPLVRSRPESGYEPEWCRA